MKEASVGCDQSFIPHHETAKGAHPRKGALHDPAAPVAAQRPTILVRRPLGVLPGWDDGLHPPALQPFPQGIAVEGPVSDQPVGPLARPAWLARSASSDRLKGLLQEGDFRRGRRGQGCSHRRPLALDPNPPLRALAPLGLPDLGPPCLAGAKLPSAKPSSQRVSIPCLKFTMNRIGF